MEPRFAPLQHHEYPEEEMTTRAREFCELLQRRRTVREFSPRPVPREIVEDCVMAAASAPNGANQQPWHFAVVSDPEVKGKIRVAAEKEEAAFYREQAPEEWLQALEPLVSRHSSNVG